MSKEILKTKKQALEWTRDMWDWLAANPTKDKYQWPGWETRQAKGTTYCACCMITETCMECPMLKTWRATKKRVFLACCDDRSPYTLWREARLQCDLVAESKAAKKIADGARKELNKL